MPEQAEVLKIDEPPVPQLKVKVSIDEEGDYVVTTEEINSEYLFDTDFAIEETGKENVIFADNMEAEGIITPVSTELEDEEGVAGTEQKKDVFKKKTSSYKSLEEAALAVDELLEELKRQQREQASFRGRNSLSQKAAGGVDGSLRNGSFGLSGYGQPDVYNANPEITIEEDLPTYYINGSLASKEEVDKIKSKDILKKVIKRSKSNPNGEWWIETRQR